MGRRLAAAAAALAVLGAACSGGGGDGGGLGPQAGSERPNLRLASSLRRLDSCDGLRTWTRDELAPRVGAYGFPGAVRPGGRPGRGRRDHGGRGGRGRVRRPSLATEAPGAAPAPSAPSQDDGSGFSTTNVQVAGVDEPDIVKTDGRRILAIAEDKLHLASVEGGAVASSIDLPEGMYDAQMLLAGDRVLLFGAGSYGDGPLAEEAPGADVARSILPIGTAPASSRSPSTATRWCRAGHYDLDGDLRGGPDDRGRGPHRCP